MSRNLSPTFLSQLASTGASTPAFFVVLEFANQTLYLFSGIGPFTPVRAGAGGSSALIVSVSTVHTIVGWRVFVNLSTVPAGLSAGGIGATLMSFSGLVAAPWLNGLSLALDSQVGAQLGFQAPIGAVEPYGPTADSGTVSWNSVVNPVSLFPYGQIFTGLGWLGKLSAIPQTTKVQAQGITMTLSGIPGGLVSDAINQVRATGKATIFLGFFDSSGNLIQDPLQLFSGSLDVPTLDDNGKTCTLSITAENSLLLLNQAPDRQFDDLDQQLYFPGDLGLSFVDKLANLALFWPSPAANASVFAVDMLMAPNGADIPVGGTVVIQTTINYSDHTSYNLPGGSGSGEPWLGGISSSNPEIATVNGAGVVTGIKPGICLIIARAVYPRMGAAPSSEKRVSCTVIVHS